MFNWSTVILLALAMPVAAKPFEANGLKQEPPWLAFGDLRGYIEPCGCDPATDLGGVMRLSGLLARERRATPELLVLSLGNNFSGKWQGAELSKNRFIAKALRQIKPSASLLAGSEMAALKFGGADFDLPSYLLSNGRPASPLTKKVSSSLVVSYQGRKVLLFGYVSPAAAPDDLLPVSTQLLATWQKTITQNPGAFVLLLFSGGDADLLSLQKSAIFDRVLSGNAAAADAVVDNKEQMQPDRLLRGSQPAPVLMTPLGGQGVLRGGPLASMRAPSLRDMLESRPHLSEPKTAWVPVSWLDNSIDGTPDMQKIMRAYNAALAKAYAEDSQKKIAALKDSTFIGAAACKTCHQAAYDVWQNSRHAAAFATLQQKRKTEDPSCVSCHVVGFVETGGFVSLQDSPHLKDVQCESCHGPRREHAQNPAKKPNAAAKDTCVSCHQGMHSPGFDYATYWNRIKHQ